MPVVGSAIIEFSTKGVPAVEADAKKVNKSLEDVSKGGEKAGVGLGDFTKGLQAASVALGAMEIASVATDLLLLSANTERAVNSLDALTGGEADTYLRAIGTAANGTVSSFDAASAASRALRFGIVDNVEDMGRLVEVSQALGQTMGITTSQAFDNLVTATSRLSAPIADNLGLVIKMEEVNRRAAIAVQLNSDLTFEQAQRQEFLNIALTEGESVIEALGEGYTDNVTKIEQLNSSVENLKVALGNLVADALIPSVEGATWLARVLSGDLKNSVDAVARESGFVEWFQSINEDLIRNSDNVHEYKRALEGLNLTQQQFNSLERNGVFNERASFNPEAFTRVRRELELNTEATERQEQAMRRLAMASGDTTDAMGEMVTAPDFDGISTSLDNIIERMARYNAEIERNSELSLGNIQAVQEFQGSYADMGGIFDFAIQGLDDFNLSATEQLSLYQALGMETGTLNEKTLTQADALGTLKGLFADGKLSAEDYVQGLSMLSQGLDIATFAMQRLADANNDAVTGFWEGGGSTADIGEFYNSQSQGAQGTSESIQNLTADLSTLIDMTGQIEGEVPIEIIENFSEALENLSPLLEDVENLRQGIMLDVQDNAGVSQQAVQILQDKANLLASKIYRLVIDVDVQGDSIPSLPGLAIGSGFTQQGAYLVGETGPEIVVLPQGASVIPTAETNGILRGDNRGDSGGIPTGTPVYLSIVLGGNTLYQGIVDEAYLRGLEFKPIGV